MKTSKHGVAPALLALSITAACASLPLHAAEIRGMSAENVIPGQYIVKFREDRVQAAGLLANASTMAMDMNRRYGARV